MKMERARFTWFSILLSLLAGLLAWGTGPFTARAATDDPDVISMDAQWRFSKGDFPLGASWGLNDADWRVVTLPHDWAIEGPFDEKAATGSAGANLPSGVAWYRKHFTLPAEAKGKRVRIEFDGVMANAEVYVNNALAGVRPNGNVSFGLDVTDLLAESGENLLAVRTDTSRQPALRWYEGAGIYRHVRLVIQDQVHLVEGSTFISTKTLTKQSATIHVESTVANEIYDPKVVTGTFTVIDPDGEPLLPLRWTSRVQLGGPNTMVADIPIADPRPWDMASPTLYGMEIVLYSKGDVIEQKTIPFGIRTAEFRADTGFWLNGNNLKLKGVGLHADMGALGIAVPASAWESRLRALQKLGVNAIRTAHNPPSPELLDACDRLGLLVMDEVFDAWSVGKTPADYHLYFGEWAERDLADVIRRDRNHPSVVVYSVGNEIWDLLPQNPDPAPDQFVGPKRTVDLARAEFLKLRAVAHREDPSRPVTMALLRANVMGLYDNGFADLMDVVGQNYRDGELAAAGAKHPQWKILGTEDYKTRETWIALRDNPKLAGQFLWAGADYLGEAGKWPNVVSPSGLLDRTNEAKGDALERESWWAEHPVLHVVRMAEVAGRPGGKSTWSGIHDWTPVRTEAHNETVAVYSNLASVELLLNGKSLGSKERDKGDAARTWQVPFEAGTLRAVAKDAEGKEMAEELRTAGAPAKVSLTAERGQLPNDGEDVDYVRAKVVDAAGVRVPSAENAVTFSVEGPGVIVATDSGALADHDSFQGLTRKTYRGTCVAIVRATADAGKLVVKGSVEGLQQGAVQIDAMPGIKH